MLIRPFAVGIYPEDAFSHGTTNIYCVSLNAFNCNLAVVCYVKFEHYYFINSIYFELQI